MMICVCVKIRKIQKSRKIESCCTEKEKRKKTNPQSLFNLTHNDDNVCENQKNPKPPEKSYPAVQRERREKKRTLEPTII